MKPSNDHTPLVVPARLDYLAGMSWRLLAVGGLIAAAIFIASQLKEVLIPFLVGLLITALLYPFTQWLIQNKVSRAAAVTLSLLAFFVIVSSLVFLVVKQVQIGYPDMHARFQSSLSQLRTTLAAEPLNIDISQKDIDKTLDEVSNYLNAHSDTLISGIGKVGTTVKNVVAGIFLTLFTAIFLLYDGKRVWRWAVKLTPSAVQTNLFDAGIKGWRTLAEFVKSQIAVAAVDAVGIGLGALLLQIPLAIPIAVMVFLGSFIPVIGAIVTGMIAVGLALVFNGWIAALIMIGVVLFVQFVEGHLLQPFLIGNAVKIHPLAVIFAVAIGSLIAGIPGALFAVPTAAVLNVMAVSLFSHEANETAPKQRPKKRSS